MSVILQVWQVDQHGRKEYVLAPEQYTLSDIIDWYEEHQGDEVESMGLCSADELDNILIDNGDTEEYLSEIVAAHGLCEEPTIIALSFN